MRQLHPARLVPAVMLGLGVFPWPYGYYQLLRVVVFGCAALLCWKAYKEGDNAETTVLTFAAIALLMNPFVPAELPRIVWAAFNVICAGVFVAHFSKMRLVPPRSSQRQKGSTGRRC